MADEIYTLGLWHVTSGQVDAFIAAWKKLGDHFLSLPQPPGQGRLVQSLDDPLLFYSFGPWPSLEAVNAMRANPSTPQWIAELSALCDEAKPTRFRLVAQAP